MKPDHKNSAQEVTDPVFNQHGVPFLVSGNGKVTINDRAVAVKCATQHLVKFNAAAKGYARYDSECGLWVTIHEKEVMQLLDNLLIQLGEDYEHEDVVQRMTAAKLGSLCKMMRPHDAKLEMESTTGLVHVSNGVVALGARKAKLLDHDAKFEFHHSADIKFDAKAKCPKFIKNFLGTSLDQDDIDLLQMYCGSMLLGPNSCHGIMIIRGTAGGGKSTLVSIIEKIIGENNVAYLRTSHLGGRFETSAFLGKRLLVGKDVPGDTLAVNGARMLKSLVGGDLMQAEIKFNPNKRQIRGDFHVVIVSNNKLRIALDGDAEAWRRRLLVIDFKNPKPAQPIVNFADKLLAQEASGILNWLIEGAWAYQREMDKHGHLQLNKEQDERVESLLHDSDNIVQFVNQNIVPKDGRDVSSEELLICYYKKCERQNWTPVPSHTFQTRVPDLLAQMFKTTRRNDIKREGRAVRGFKNVTLV